MCGFVGIIGHPQPDSGTIESLRDLLTHRGPDGAGLWRAPGVSLGHRRLAVLDTSEAGTQPMLHDNGSLALVYNGELFNDADLRARLTGSGTRVRFRSRCDTETLVHWLAGLHRLDDLRGMFAFAAVDTSSRTLTLARDPLGIKPLYWARLPGRVLFASEVTPILEHPEFDASPDIAGVRAYLATIRTVIDEQTMFAGVHAVRPGEVLRFDLDDPDAMPLRTRIAVEPAVGITDSAGLRRVLDESISAHLRTDVPLCSLLSGGLDSTIVAQHAVRFVPSLRTFCSGATGSHADVGTDLEYAQRVADALGTHHTPVVVDEASFLETWWETVPRTGLPMSTPNEVSIRLIARTLRADGCLVALSGEGADEFLAGYDEPMRLAHEHVINGNGRPGRFHLDAHAWMSPSQQQTLLPDSIWIGDPDDDALVSRYERLFTEASDGVADPLAGHLRFHQRVNLVGLLQRLDSAMMLESVEGRTPFADRKVQAAVWSMPMEAMYNATGAAMHERTKLALRRAYRDAVPREVLQRNKASFPLPFQDWLGGAVRRALDCSEAASAFVAPTTLAAVGADPGRHWNFAWPLFNLAMWADRWWGTGRGQSRTEVQASAASARGTAASSRRV